MKVSINGKSKLEVGINGNGSVSRPKLIKSCRGKE